MLGMRGRAGSQREKAHNEEHEGQEEGRGVRARKTEVLRRG